MPLKIRCPHCLKILLAEDETAGQLKLCPSCGRPITVPMPVRADTERVEVAQDCPRCGHKVAPGTAYCPKCWTELATGKRLPFGQRLRRMPFRVWATGLVAAIGILLIILVAANLLRTYAKRPSARGSRAVGAVQVDVEKLAREFLNAGPDAPTDALRRKLLQTEHAGLVPLADALRDSLSDGSADSTVAGRQCAAIELLVRLDSLPVRSAGGADVGAAAVAHAASARAHAVAVLAECQRSPALCEAALLARGRLGDSAARDDLLAAWRRHLSRALFFQRLADVISGERAAGAQAFARHAQLSLDEIVDALRALVVSGDERTLPAACESYWQSWGWLGQRRGESVLAALFELAKPSPRSALRPDSADTPAAVQAVRAARRALEAAAETGSAASTAAVGLVLLHAAPQYQSARQRVVARLAAALPDATPLDQQRSTWTLACLLNRQFAGVTENSSPADVDRDAVAAALSWARQNGMIAETAGGKLRSDYPRPPALTYRVVTPQRQLEAELLTEMAGWESLEGALDRWDAAGLDCTPRIVALLDPGQHDPVPSVLAGVLVIAAESGGPELRRNVELWTQAHDQPVELRGLAHLAAGALAARTGGVDPDWSARMPAGAFSEAASAASIWQCFVRALSAGGEPLRQRWRNVSPAIVPASIRDTLGEAAKRFERRRASRFPR